MLLVVCPNLAIDRILEVENFEAGKVQRSRSVLTQPGGKGSNVARVFRQLGDDVVLVGFVGKANRDAVCEPLLRMGVHVDAVTAHSGESRTCTIVCDTRGGSHPTVINEESAPVEPRAAAALMQKVRKWLRVADAVLTTGSLATGLSVDFYAEILSDARVRGKLTALDASGAVLWNGLLAKPSFVKPNAEEFNKLKVDARTAGFITLPSHTAITFGRAGAVLIHEGRCLYGSPPELFDTNPIGTGDAFVAAYLHSLLQRKPAAKCFQRALAAAASDASTLPPGVLDLPLFHSLSTRVELRFL